MALLIPPSQLRDWSIMHLDMLEVLLMFCEEGGGGGAPALYVWGFTWL